MRRLKWHYHKKAAGALYKQQCHMSAVTATVTTDAIMFGHRWKMPWSAAFLSVTWTQCTIQMFWQTPAEHSSFMHIVYCFVRITFIISRIQFFCRMHTSMFHVACRQKTTNILCLALTDRLNNNNRLMQSFIRLQTVDNFLVAWISIVEVRFRPHQRNFRIWQQNHRYRPSSPQACTNGLKGLRAHEG